VSRNKKFFFNTLTSILYQVTAIICGFILPNMILHYYGSEVNGLIQSITQFLSFITFLEMGVGAVIQSALYKPLAQKNEYEMSCIIVSGQKFFRKIAYILFIYILILCVFYPIVIKNNFGFIFTGLLILALSVSSFAQYYFGIIDRLLLNADQHGYVQYLLQIVTLIINVICCVILIKLKMSIHVVKLTTSIIFLIRPLFIRWYINKNYNIDRKITLIEEPIKQKWNGVAQHIAVIVLDGTDTIVLSVFSTLTNVSIYSVYNLVINGLKQLFRSILSGVQSVLGELWAKQDMNGLHHFFNNIEWIFHTIVIIIFGCTSTLIVPFVMVYTQGMNDANYYVPFFAFLITLAHVFYGLRMPYHSLILAVGHYKETQHIFIIAASLNIMISVFMVYTWGLIGVAIGTFIAMLYQTISMAIYVSKKILKRSMLPFIKHMMINSIVFCLGYFIANHFHLSHITYYDWIRLAFRHLFIWLSISMIMNGIFFRSQLVMLFKNIVLKLKRIH